VVVDAVRVHRHRTERRHLADRDRLDPALGGAFEQRERQLRIVHSPAPIGLYLRWVHLEPDRVG
jgi:hypothetical protein